MATLQSRKSKGKKYWYVVESKRINGKPRPIVIQYLGSIEKIMEMAQGEKCPQKIKSYSHGAVSAFLSLAEKFKIIPIINKYTNAKRKDWAKKPIRNGLTAGATFLLGSIGRACNPTSKRGWFGWAKTTSCEHLLKLKLKNIDSQHFWNMMDCLPEESIPKMEEEILKNVLKEYPLNKDTLFYDTTNFFTFIASQNDRCEIAKRGKNKQKRSDLRQVGMALVVSQNEHIPLLHHTYEGNTNDCEVFRKLIFSIKKRMKILNINSEKHTLVFDRGCNSKKNLKHIKRLKLHYVAALTPYHHKSLIEEAKKNIKNKTIEDQELNIYRTKKIIWGEERTVLVFISKKLKLGCIQGIHQNLRKKRKQLRNLQKALLNPKAKKRTKENLEISINKILTGKYDLISYEIISLKNGKWQLSYKTNFSKLKKIEKELGFRIVMTNRHSWNDKDIVKAFHGQSNIENAFKDVKNPYHLAVRPSFHWTDQKIKVHFFLCVIGYLISTIILHEAKKTGFKGSLNSLLNKLNEIRISTLIEITGKRGKPRCIHKLEEISLEQNEILRKLNLTKMHLKKLRMQGVSVYN
jgi:transposase